jgi:hypothetical protein
MDVTPGAETNPYRFVAFNQRTLEFKDRYAATPACDGRKYSDELWLTTVREWIDATDRIFKRLPLVVTLNVGTLNLGDARNDYSVMIGQYAEDHGFYVGQNGLHVASYAGDSERKAAFLKWSKQTRIVFETLGDAGTTTRRLPGAARAGGGEDSHPVPYSARERGSRGAPGAIRIVQGSARPKQDAE